MFKQLFLGTVLLLVIFCPTKILADEFPLSSAQEEKYLAEIKKNFPSSDERHQFALAMNKVGVLLSASAKADFFIAGRIFAIIEPFLNSKNDKIKICSENTLRMVKSGFKFQMMITPPDDASVEEVQQAMKDMKKDVDRFMSCYIVFLKSCVSNGGKSIY